MTQAFCDRLTERGEIRTWMLVISDLSFSVPQEIVEATMMSQKWMGSLAAIGAVVSLASVAIGARGFALVGLGVGVAMVLVGALSLWSASRSGRPTEFSFEGSAPKRWTWWTVLATLMAAIYVVGAASLLISDPKGTNVGALGIAIGFASLIAIGLRLRSRSRVAGNWLVVVAMVPALTFFWVIVPAVVALAVIIGAVVEVSRATPQTPQTA